MISYKVGSTHYATIKIKGIEGGFLGKGRTIQEAINNMFKNING